MLRESDLDGAAMREKRGRRIEPDQRGAERCPLHLLDMIGVIKADRDELAGSDRQIDLKVAQRQDPFVEFHALPIRFRQDMDGIPPHLAVEKFAISSKAAKSLHRNCESCVNERCASRSGG